MKTAIFIRTAPYKYKQPERNLYKSLDLIGRQDAQPHISLPLSTEAHLKITAIRDIYHHAVTGKVLCCSHGFIMKLFENFFRRRCAVARFQDIVLDHDWTKATYGFLDGFMLNFSDLNDER